MENRKLSLFVSQFGASPKLTTNTKNHLAEFRKPKLAIYTKNHLAKFRKPKFYFFIVTKFSVQLKKSFPFPPNSIHAMRKWFQTNKTGYKRLQRKERIVFSLFGLSDSLFGLSWTLWFDMCVTVGSFPDNTTPQTIFQASFNRFNCKWRRIKELLLDLTHTHTRTHIVQRNTTHH